MRVLHVVGSMNRAGAETLIMNIYRNIDRSKVQFDFLYFGNKKCDFDNEIIELGGIIHRVDGNTFIKRIQGLRKFFKKYNSYSHIHSHLLLFSAFVNIIAKFYGNCKTFTHAHSSQDDTIQNRFIRVIYHFLSKLIIWRTTNVQISCGRSATDFLFPFSSKKTLLVNNGLDLSKYINKDIHAIERLRHEFGISSLEKVIVQVGRLHPVKNHSFSLAIMKELYKRGFLFKYLIIGQGELSDHLKQQTKDFGLQNEVIFTGIRSDIPLLLQLADLVLMPSINEGFPVSLVEAQAAGVPSLVSTGVPEEVDLGLGLVEFLSLQSSAANWIEKIFELTSQVEILEDSVRLDLLKRKGFDIMETSDIIQDLYLNT